MADEERANLFAEIPKDLKDAFTELCRRNGQSITWRIERLIRGDLASEEASRET